MGVYIKGITRAQAIAIVSRNGESIRSCDIIEVPTPHGRLIDESRIDYKNYKMHKDGKVLFSDDFFFGIKWLSDCISETPTVIEEEADRADGKE